MLLQLRVTSLVFGNYGIHQLGEEGAVDAQHPAMTSSTAQQTAQHRAAALVGGQNAIAYHKGSGTDVVGDYTDGDIGLGILTIGLAADFFHMVQNGPHGVHLKQVAHTLHYAGQTLQAHAGVNVGTLQTGVVALAVGIELAEHQVPNLHVAVAIAANLAGGLVAAVLGATVKVDFAARAAGTRTMLPEVILLAKAHHVILRNADFLSPDVPGFVVLLVYRNVQQLRRNFQHLGQKFPGPVDGFPLEVILKAEVAQHFKVGAMTGSDAYTLNIRGTDALLAGGNPMAGRLFLAQEPFFHGSHAAVNQQQAVVVLGHQGKTAQAQMFLAFKKREIFLSQFIQTSPLHCRLLLFVCCVSRSLMPLQGPCSTKKNSPRPCCYRDEG